MATIKPATRVSPVDLLAAIHQEGTIKDALDRLNRGKSRLISQHITQLRKQGYIQDGNPGTVVTAAGREKLREAGRLEPDEEGPAR